jgi:DNA-binding CsgD family transcriptional regulator
MLGTAPPTLNNPPSLNNPKSLANPTTLNNPKSLTNPTEQNFAEIAFHTRQLAVSMLSYPVRAERARALVAIVLDDPQTGQSTYVERLLASVLIDVHLVLGERDTAQALCNRIDLCSSSVPADALVSVRAAAALAVFDLRFGLAVDSDQVIELICRLEVLAADTGGDQLERARAALLIGRAWALLDKDRSAAMWLESAAVLFERAGQPQWSRLTRQEASTVHQGVFTGVGNGIGVPSTVGTPLSGDSHLRTERPHVHSTDDWQVGLTPAERRVALLIGGGRSNREAADELYVSVKTVESHVQSVFRKLGMHRRSELANLVGRTLAA